MVYKTLFFENIFDNLYSLLKFMYILYVKRVGLLLSITIGKNMSCVVFGDD